MQQNENQSNVIPSMAYIWEQEGAKTAVIVVSLNGKRGQHATVVDLNNGAAFPSVQVKYLKPMTFLPFPLGLYAGHDVTKVRELAQFLLANFGDQLQTGSHPCDEAKRMLGDVPNHLLGAFFDFLAYLTSREEPIIVGTQHDCPPIIEAFNAWIATRNLNPDKYTANVKNWHKNIARGVATQEVTGNANVVVEIVRTLLDLAHSEDTRADTADKLKVLAYKLGKTVGMEA